MINYLPPPFIEQTDVLTQLYPEEIANGRRPYEITFQVTEDCCMACTYCYQHNKSPNKMSFDIAKITIDKLLNDEFEFVNTKNTFALLVSFIGGEPLMEIDLIEQICEYMLQRMIQLEHPWLYHINFFIGSNGLLYFTPKVQNFIKKYQVFVNYSVSIDGNKELHDSCRIDLLGNGTYDRALSAIKDYSQRYNKNLDTKMTLSPDNIIYTSQALIGLIKEGYTLIPLNCIFEEGWDYSHARILYKELKIIADYILDNNLYNKVNIKMFEEQYYSPLPEEDNNNWCGGVEMQTLSIDYKGDIYPCIRYMSSALNNNQEPLFVGNISSGCGTTQKEKENINMITNITRRSQSTDECFYCPIASGCAWCSGYNYEKFGTPNKRATFICVMHQATALANVYYWNNLYKKLNIPKRFSLYLEKDKALNIINEQEYNYLLDLSRKD